MAEKHIQSACLQILEVCKIFAWRNNTGAFKGTYKGKKRFIQFGAVGSPDIIAVHKGKFLGIECKDKGKKQRESQIIFQKKLENAGAIYLLVDDPTILIDFLKDFV